MRENENIKNYWFKELLIASKTFLFLTGRIIEHEEFDGKKTCE